MWMYVYTNRCSMFSWTRDVLDHLHPKRDWVRTFQGRMRAMSSLHSLPKLPQGSLLNYLFILFFRSFLRLTLFLLASCCTCQWIVQFGLLGSDVRDANQSLIIVDSPRCIFFLALSSSSSKIATYQSSVVRSRKNYRLVASAFAWNSHVCLPSLITCIHYRFKIFSGWWEASARSM